MERINKASGKGCYAHWLTHWWPRDTPLNEPDGMLSIGAFLCLWLSRDVFEDIGTLLNPFDRKPKFVIWLQNFDPSSIDGLQFSAAGQTISDLSVEEENDLYRSKQRGFLELDLVLGKWVEENIFSMDECGIKSLVHVLDMENPSPWKWLTNQEQPPDAVNNNSAFSALREKVMGNLENHASPGTRATPGQPWVRGWDDLKRGRGNPISGNQ
ncbi:succinate dehydrogenase assembly factor 2, mitochondrial-like [Papaver somniferum]|uniref:succinate dehydrogenase assembly factor 2, mitochondrial-like n=1 Tax=Papaver somniferum TaxID=3469 RepID=UPI000E703C30|nr:succinate dehydrogenase assembly factor 2, mitochondrial-like [Papaver somniferum]